MLVIQNALFIHFDTDDFFKQLEQSILYTFWDFEQHLQQEDCGIPQDKVEMAEAGTNTPEIHQSTEDIWNPSPPPSQNMTIN